jgi:threonyl-tRNA synthetase
MISIKLKDGSQRQYAKGTTLLQICEDISPKLAKNAVAAVFNGQITGLSTEIDRDGVLEILNFDDDKAKKVYRHSSSHVMAQAVKRLWPEAKLAIGPAIDKGFYYDFANDHTFTPEDFLLIEEEMNRIIKSDYPIIKKEISREDALKLFAAAGEDYKVRLIEDLPDDEEISIYEQGEFVDLCVGPHVPSTGRLKAIKIMSLAGAYWRGDEKNEMLQRIYATSFPQKAMLDEYLQKIEEAKRRDHRKLGKELGLFVVLDEGPGFPFFLPKGMVLRNELENFWREAHHKAGYQEIRTPIILNKQLWERSGHWDHYKDNMYYTKIDDQDYNIKPMNCPGGILVYKQNLHSYKELPLRMGELGLVHRHEMSGVLHGLMRVSFYSRRCPHLYAAGTD